MLSNLSQPLKADLAPNIIISLYPTKPNQIKQNKSIGATSCSIFQHSTTQTFLLGCKRRGHLPIILFHYLWGHLWPDPSWSPLNVTCQIRPASPLTEDEIQVWGQLVTEKQEYTQKGAPGGRIISRFLRISGMDGWNQSEAVKSIRGRRQERAISSLSTSQIY